MIIGIESKLIPFERKFQGFCKLPFYKHSHGCPNYGKKEDCPPNQPLINELFDFNKELYVIYTKFPIQKFAERMKQLHPEWSDFPRQLYNPRRWQPVARKEHNQELEKLAKNLIINKSPEANGVNVTELMKRLGITLNWEWPPKHNNTYMVSLAGHNIETEKPL